MAARAVILATNEVQDCLLLFPYHTLAEQGVQLDVAGPRTGVVVGANGYAIAANVCFSEIDASQYDLLVLPSMNGREHICLDRGVSRVLGESIAAGKALAPRCRQGRIGLHVLGCEGRPSACPAATFTERTCQCPDELPVSCRWMFEVLRGSGACAAQDACWHTASAGADPAPPQAGRRGLDGNGLGCDGELPGEKMS
jgi:hypothetical protein